MVRPNPLIEGPFQSIKFPHTCPTGNLLVCEIKWNRQGQYLWGIWSEIIGLETRYDSGVASDHAAADAAVSASCAEFDAMEADALERIRPLMGRTLDADTLAEIRKIYADVMTEKLARKSNLN